MIENWDKVQSALNTSLDSGGKAMQQFEEAQNGIEYQTNQTRAAMEKLFRVMVDNNGIIMANKIWGELVKQITNFLEVMSPTTIFIIGLNRLIATLAKQKLTALNLDFVKMGSSIKTVTQNMKGFGSEILRVFKNNGLFNAFKTGLTSIKNLWDSIKAKPADLSSVTKISATEITKDTKVDTLDKVKAMNNIIDDMSMSKKQQKLLTEQEKIDYDAIIGKLQVYKNMFEEIGLKRKQIATITDVENLDKNIKRDKMDEDSDELKIYTKLLILADDLNAEELERCETIDDITKALLRNLDVQEDLNTEAAEATKLENKQKISQMKINNVIKTGISEAIALMASLTAAYTTFVNARSNATNRFEAQTASIQFEMQSTIASLQSGGAFLNSVADLIPGKVGKALSIFSQIGTQVISTIYTVMKIKEQERLNDEKKRIQEATTAVEEFANKLNDIKELRKELLSIGDAFLLLSKGIGENGENLRLTNNEFSKYNEYANRIAEILPDVVKGYTEQGNAILDNADNMDFYLKKMKEAEKEQAALAAGSMDMVLDEKVKQHAFNYVNSSTEKYIRNEETVGALSLNKAFREGNRGDTLLNVAATAAPLAIGGAIVGKVVATSIGAAIGTAIAPGIGTKIGAAIGLAIGTAIGIGISSITTKNQKIKKDALDELKDSTEYKKATKEQQKLMEENTKRDMDNKQKRVQSLAKRQNKQRVLDMKKTFDQNYQVIKASDENISDLYDELGEKDQKQIDLMIDRINFGEVYVEKLNEVTRKLQEDPDSGFVGKDQEEQEKMIEEKMQPIMQDLEMAQASITEAFTRNAGTIDNIFIDSRKLEEEFKNGEIMVGEYEERYKKLNDQVRKILEKSGIDQAYIDNFMKSFELSEVGSEFERLDEHLKELKFDIDKVKEAGIDMSLQMVNGVKSLIDAYSQLLPEERIGLGDYKSFSADLEKIIKEDSSGEILKNIEAWENAKQINDIKAQTQAQIALTKAMEGTGNAAKMMNLALSEGAVQAKIDIEITRQVFFSFIREIKNQATAVSDFFEMLEKVGENGRVSLTDALDIIGKFPSAIKSIERDADGLLVFDTSQSAKLALSGYSQAQRQIDEYKKQLEDAGDIGTNWSKLSNALVYAKSTGQTIEKITDVQNMLQDLKDDANLTQSELKQWGFESKDDIDTILMYMNSYSKQLEPILDKPKDLMIKSLEDIGENAKKQVEIVENAVETIGKITLDTVLLEQIKTLEDKMKEATKSLKEFNKDLRETRKRLKEIRSGEAEAKIVNDFTKAVKNYDKTMKGLAEDNVVTEINHGFLDLDYTVIGITSKLENVKTMIDLIGDTDPSASLKEYNKLMSLTADKAVYLQDKMDTLMNLREPQSAAEVKEIVSQMEETSDAIIENYKEGIEAQQKVKEINDEMTSQMRTNTSEVSESIINYSKTINTSLDRSMQLLKQGSITGGIRLQRINIFGRISEENKDPIALMKYQNERRIEEYQKYIDKINELRKKEAEFEYEETKKEIYESEADAVESLADATKDAVDSFTELNDEYDELLEKQLELNDSIAKTTENINILRKSVEELNDTLRLFEKYEGIFGDDTKFSVEDQVDILKWLDRNNYTLEESKDIMQDLEKIDKETVLKLVDLDPKHYEDSVEAITDIIEKGVSQVTEILLKSKFSDIIKKQSEESANALSSITNPNLINPNFSSYIPSQLNTPFHPSLKGYAAGTSGTKSNEHALTGELGKELAILPNGKMKVLGENGPEMSYIPKGTIIYNHKDTEKIMTYMNDPNGKNINNYTNLNSYANGTTFLPSPLGPSGKDISNLFSANHGGGEKAYDIPIPVGNSVYSIASGIVEKIGLNPANTWNIGVPSYGNYVMVNHNNGFKSLYGHLQSIGVSKGQEVNNVSMLGTSGNSGYSSGPHLHFHIVNSSGQYVKLEDFVGKTGSNFVSTGNVVVDKAILNAAEKYNLDPNILKAIAYHESRFNPNAFNKNVNGTVDSGLMQLNQTTWSTLGVTDPYDPNQSAMGAAKLISDYLNGAADGDLSAAFGMYAAGEYGYTTSNKEWARKMAQEFIKIYNDYGGNVGNTSFPGNISGFSNFDSGLLKTIGIDNKPSKSRLQEMVEELQQKPYRSSNNKSSVKNNDTYVSPNGKELYLKKSSGVDLLIAKLVNGKWVYEANDISSEDIKASINGLSKYAVGTKGTTRAEPALVGELGEETAILPNGKIKMLGKNGPEIVNLPKGTIIYNNEDTKDIKKYIKNPENSYVPKYKSGTTSLTKHADGTMNNEEYRKLIDSRYNIAEVVDDFIREIRNMTVEDINATKDIINKLENGSISKEITNMNNNLKKTAISSGISSTEIEGITKPVEKTADIFSGLSNILKDNNIILDKISNGTVTEDEVKELRSQLVNGLTSVGSEMNNFTQMFDEYMTNSDSPEAASQQAILEAARNVQNVDPSQREAAFRKQLEDMLGKPLADKILGNYSDLAANFNDLITNEQEFQRKNSKLTESDLKSLREQFNNADKSLFNMIESMNKYNMVIDRGKETYEYLLQYLTLQMEQQKDLDRQIKDVLYLRNKMTESGELQLFEESVNQAKQIQDVFDTILDSIGGQGLIDAANEKGINLGEFKVEQKDEWIKWAKENVTEFQTLMTGFVGEESSKILVNALDNFGYIMDKFGVDLLTITNQAIITAQKKLDNEREKLSLIRSLDSSKIINDEIDKYNKELKNVTKAYKRGGMSLHEAASQIEQMSNEMQFFILHTQKIRAETDIEEATFFKDEAEKKAKAALANNDIEGFKSAKEEYDKWQNQLESAQDTLIKAGEELFSLAYTQTFKRFNDEVEKLQNSFNTAVSLNQALGRTSSKLFDVKIAKEETKYSQQNQRILEMRIDALKKLQSEIDPSAYEKIKEIDKEILDLEKQVSDEKIKQIELTRRMVDSSFEIVKQVADRIQREIDAMKFGEGLKDRITEINNLRLEIMELREIWNPADLDINWDAGVQNVWQNIPKYIDNITVGIDRYQEMLDYEDKLANLAEERMGLDPLTDAKAIEESYRRQAELISQAVISAKEGAKIQQERIGMLNEELRIAKQQRANQQHAYNMLIKEKQAEIDALTEQKEEEQEIDELIKLRLELIKAMDDVSHSYITGAGIEIMRPDEEKIDDLRGQIAEKEKEDILQSQIDALQDEITQLEEERDTLGKMADIVIAGYEYEIQMHQDELDRLIDFADKLTSGYENLMNGIPPIILDQMKEEWALHVDGWDNLMSNLDSWFNNELKDNFMTPIMDSLEDFADLYNTGIKDQEAIVDRMEQILNEDLAKSIDNFRGSIDDFDKSLDKLRDTEEKYLDDLYNLLNTLGGDKPSGIISGEGNNEESERNNNNRNDNKNPDKTTPKPKPKLEKGQVVELKPGAKWYGNQSGGKASSPVNGPFTIEKVSNGGDFNIHLLQSDGTWGGWVRQQDIVGYKTGGLNTDTGLAWLDGTPSSPELVLNSQDTQNFLQLTDLLRKLELDELFNDLKVDFDKDGTIKKSLSYIANVLSESSTSKVHIDNVNLPSVENGSDFIDELSSFVDFGRNALQ